METPLIETSVGALISSGFGGVIGAGGRGCARGRIVASRGRGVEAVEVSPADGGLDDLDLDMYLFILGGGLGA